MSTRSLLLVEKNQNSFLLFYRHHDGYWTGAGEDLVNLLKKHRKAKGITKSFIAELTSSFDYELQKKSNYKDLWYEWMEAIAEVISINVMSQQLGDCCPTCNQTPQEKWFAFGAEYVYVLTKEKNLKGFHKDGKIRELFSQKELIPAS